MGDNNTRFDLQKLEKIIAVKEKEIENAPEGSLNIKHTKGHPQYFQYIKDVKGEPAKRKYLGLKDKTLIKALAQKDYDVTLLKTLKKQWKALKYYKEHYPERTVDDIYEGLSPLRQALVKPLRLTDSQYVKAWLETPYRGKEFTLDDPGTHYTEKGERVRSKSEVIIADTLYHEGIPYKYECPLNLGGMTVYPDFTVLNVRTRRILYLEHFGMIDKDDYADSFVRKEAFYEANGILQGSGLIMTFETSRRSLDKRHLKNIISHYFK